MIRYLRGIWLLGKHRLICGDSTKAETYKRLMDGKKANLCVTDPPYNVNYTAGKRMKERLKMITWKIRAFMNSYYGIYNIFAKLDDGAGAYIFTLIQKD